MLEDDRLDTLARVLYGRKATVREWLGGSDAKILADAADRIVALMAERDALKEALRHHQ